MHNRRVPPILLASCLSLLIPPWHARGCAGLRRMLIRVNCRANASRCVESLIPPSLKYGT